MSTAFTDTCFRKCSTCTPLANLSSDEDEGFICVGLNRPGSRSIKQDRFTLCWKSKNVDEKGDWDKRDLIDTMSIIAQALSVDENIRVNNNFTESEMQENFFK